VAHSWLMEFVVEERESDFSNKFTCFTSQVKAFYFSRDVDFWLEMCFRNEFVLLLLFIYSQSIKTIYSVKLN